MNKGERGPKKQHTKRKSDDDDDDKDEDEDDELSSFHMWTLGHL